MSPWHTGSLSIATSFTYSFFIVHSADAYVATGSTVTEPALAADLLREVDALRQKFTPFIKNIVPKKKEEPRAANAGGSSPAPPPPVRPGPGIGGDRDNFPFGSSQRIPPVGSGDVLPPGLGGGEPGMLVGPDSALFGRRYDPSQGPVPGSRFDPYGPPIDPLRMPGFGGVGGGRPGPNVPFGTPNPDHLRMPREDDDMDFGFGRQPARRGGGGDPSHRPFGSDHSFF